jgi:hypothetical protein
MTAPNRKLHPATSIATPWTRRRFISTVATSSAAASIASSIPTTASAAPRKRRASFRKLKVAIIATEVRKYSHAQHFVDRFLEGYGWQGEHHFPPMQLAGLYVDQFPEKDLSRERARRHRLKIYPTIEETLTLGRSKLAVDGVILIGEHGLYPHTIKGQTLYPRNEFFERTVKVFEQSGRSVPVFNDKHLSTDWDECVAMMATAKRMGFPFLAGSSLPVTWRIPSIDPPLGAPLEESLAICYGRIDSYDIHGLETAQCISERRAGGEGGVKNVQALRGPKVWERLEANEQTRQLFYSALSRSFTCKGPKRYPAARPELSWIKKRFKNPVAYFFEHNDGFKTSMFMVPDLVHDFTYAGRLKGGKHISCLMYLPMPPKYTTLADFFNPQVNHIEQMILTGKTPYPAERTLLTSGMTLFAIDSLYQGQIKLPTPQLKISYDAPSNSSHWRV